MKRTLQSPVLIAAALVAWLAFLPGTAGAQQYPTGPIRILVGFGPGSVLDILARVVGKHMEKELGQAIVVENRLGNGSMIAAEAAESYRAEVVRVLAVVDREQGASQIFQQRGYPFTPLFSIGELLPAGERG